MSAVETRTPRPEALAAPPPERSPGSSPSVRARLRRRWRRIHVVTVAVVVVPYAVTCVGVAWLARGTHEVASVQPAGIGTSYETDSVASMNTVYAFIDQQMAE